MHPDGVASIGRPALRLLPRVDIEPCRRPGPQDAPTRDLLTCMAGRVVDFSFMTLLRPDPSQSYEAQRCAARRAAVQVCHGRASATKKAATTTGTAASGRRRGTCRAARSACETATTTLSLRSRRRRCRRRRCSGSRPRRARWPQKPGAAATRRPAIVDAWRRHLGPPASEFAKRGVVVRRGALDADAVAALAAAAAKAWRPSRRIY